MFPKSKRSAIREIYIDSDGIWIALEKGWNADGMDYPARLIHCGDEESVDSPDVIEDLKYQISKIRKLPAKEIKELQHKFKEYEW
jgi:hypothetical protein